MCGARLLERPFAGIWPSFFVVMSRVLQQARVGARARHCAISLAVGHGALGRGSAAMRVSSIGWFAAAMGVCGYLVSNHRILPHCWLAAPAIWRLPHPHDDVERPRAEWGT